MPGLNRRTPRRTLPPTSRTCKAVWNSSKRALKEVRQTPAPAAAPPRRPPPAEAARPTTVEPPFRLLDIELRAGERFLSIAPADSRSLAAVRVLRLGETESGWRLESLEGRTATFLFNGQARRLSVP